MQRRPPRSTRTASRFPDTTLFQATVVRPASPSRSRRIGRRGPWCWRSSCRFTFDQLIGRIEDVALARINLARDAGDEHIATLEAHRAFKGRDQIAVRSEENTSELQ